MAPTQAICTTFKVELMTALHNFTVSTGHAFKIALVTSASTISATTDHYSGGTNNISGEVANGSGYTTGGTALVNVTPTNPSGVTAITDFGPTDPVWTSSTITARGALIYNTTSANRSVLVLDFVSDKSSSAGDFTVVMPAADATNAIIRIA
jgi:hypothetical protein